MLVRVQPTVARAMKKVGENSIVVQRDDGKEGV